MEEMAAVVRLEHNVVELLNGLQRTLVLHRVLVGVVRLSTQGTRGSNEALTANGSKHVVWLQAILCHHVWLHPDAQRIRVTKRHHVAHTRDTHQAWLQVDVDVVSHEVIVILAIHAPQGTNLQDVALHLEHLHTHFRHLRRQQSSGTRHTVLHVHSRDVRVGALLEINYDAHVAR